MAKTEAGPFSQELQVGKDKNNELRVQNISLLVDLISVIMDMLDFFFYFSFFFSPYHHGSASGALKRHEVKSVQHVWAKPSYPLCILPT